MLSYESKVSSQSDFYLYTPSSSAKNMFFYPLLAGYFHYLPGYLLKRSSYDSFLMMLITRGHLSVGIGDENIIAKAGEVVLIDCYAPHSYGTKNGCEALWLHYDGPLARRYYEFITDKNGHIIHPENLVTFEQAVKQIYTTLKSRSPLNEATASKNITVALTELILSDRSTAAEKNLKSHRFDTISYMNEHFSENLSLTDLAKRASLSPFYFTRIFTKETGVTPHQYLIRARLNAAKFLLGCTDLSVKDISIRCGFNSESSFCITFKKWENMTPGSYRSLS